MVRRPREDDEEGGEEEEVPAAKEMERATEAAPPWARLLVNGAHERGAVPVVLWFSHLMWRRSPVVANGHM